jgi:chromate transporter
MLEKVELYWQLFIGFVRPGLFGFGGGPASIPFIEKEVVQHYGWLNQEEFLDILALGNTLPGPITTKLAAIIGYKVAGIPGMFFAISGMVVPTAILVVILTSLYVKYKNIPKIDGVIQVLKVIVIVLLLQVTWELGLKGVTDKLTVGIFIFSLLAVFLLNVHPLLLIGAGIVFALIFI